MLHILVICFHFSHFIIIDLSNISNNIPIEYTGFIFVAAIGYLFFNEIPSLRVIIGAMLIILSGAYIIYKTR